MNERIVVREAQAADAEVLTGLSAELGYPSSPQAVADRLERVLADGEQCVLVACLPDGAAVGWIHVFVALRIESDPFAEIGGFVVSEDFRG